MRVDSGGVGIEFDVHGDAGAPVVVLLHGFPDSARLWRNQVPALVEAGYRVVAPDGRGYGRSDKPEGVDSYFLPFLAADVVAVIDAVGVEKAHVVGHDWGAAVAWATATFSPDRVDHLATLAVGHPSAFRLSDYEQGRKSWYMLLFQHPVAEQWLSADGWANLRNWGQHPDHDGVVADLEASGGITSALNWYRASITPEAWAAPALELPPIQSPTMGIWGSEDFALTEGQMVGSSAFVAGPWRYERIDGAGHWMQLEAPDRVNELLVDFLAS